MFPVLTTDSLLPTLGLGTLSDAISCEVEEERNGAYELTLQYPQGGAHDGDIALNALILAKPNFTDDPQPFRIYAITKEISGIIEVHAQHISYDLGGVIVSPTTMTGATCKQAGDYLLTGTPFTFKTDKTNSANFKVDVPSSARSWLGGKSGSLLSVYGSGEYHYDGYDVEFNAQRGTNRGVQLRYGKNLTELTSEADCTNLASSVVCYYEDNGTVTSGTAVSTGLVGITRELAVDVTDEYNSAPSTATLTARATQYIADHNLTAPKTNITLDFVQASKLKDRVDLCDTVSIYYEALGVSAVTKCIRTVWDVLAERYTETEFGDAKTNIADTIVAVEKTAAESVTKTVMQQAIDSATEQITGNNGGYVVLHDSNNDGEPDEILVMNTANISTATKIWRFNSSGLGYSSTGYSGPYGLAITQQGEIVADYITAGTLSANIIRAGILTDALGYNYWNLDTGEFSIAAVGALSDRIDHMGGRNLLLDSATKHLFPYNSPTISFTDNVTVSEWSCNDAIRANGTRGTSYLFGLLRGTSQASATSINGQKYAFSIYIKNNAAETLNVGINNLGTGAAVQAGETRRVVLYGTGDGSNNVQFTFSCNSAFDFVYWHPMIEYGEVATDWSPAPEDKVGNDEIISKINVSPENITIAANKVDLQGYVTFSNLSTSGQTTINGANITTGLIKDAQNNNSWNLNTGTLNITNGSVKITTSNATTDYIKLTYGDNSVKMSSFTLIAANSSTNVHTGIQSDGIYIVDDSVDVWTARLLSNSLTFRDNTEQTRTQLNNSGLAFTNSAGQQLANFGTGSITFTNSSGVVREYFGASSMYMTNASGLDNVRISGASFTLGNTTDWGSIHVIDSTNGNDGVWIKGGGNSPGIYVYDSSGVMQARLEAETLNFYDSNGNTTATYLADGYTRRQPTPSHTSLTLSTAVCDVYDYGRYGVVQLNLNITSGFNAGTTYTLCNIGANSKTLPRIFMQMVTNQTGNSAALVQIDTSGDISIYRYSGSNSFTGWLRCVIPVAFSSI